MNRVVELGGKRGTEYSQKLVIRAHERRAKKTARLSRLFKKELAKLAEQYQPNSRELPEKIYEYVHEKPSLCRKRLWVKARSDLFVRLVLANKLHIDQKMKIPNNMKFGMVGTLNLETTVFEVIMMHKYHKRTLVKIVWNLYPKIVDKERKLYFLESLLKHGMDKETGIMRYMTGAGVVVATLEDKIMILKSSIENIEEGSVKLNYEHIKGWFDKYYGTKRWSMLCEAVFGSLPKDGSSRSEFIELLENQDKINRKKISETEEAASIYEISRKTLVRLVNIYSMDDELKQIRETMQMLKKLKKTGEID